MIKKLIIALACILLYQLPCLADEFFMQNEITPQSIEMPKTDIGYIAPVDDWTKRDNNLQTAITIMQIIDWGQTTTIATQKTYKYPNFPDGSPYPDYTEANPILGAYPSLDTVNIYFLACIIGDNFIAHKLHGKWRTRWQILT
jgi:hypothetical protein